jgi:hypothetical protein
MNLSLRSLLYRVEPESQFIVTAPDVESGENTCAYPLIWAARLHHERLFPLPDGGFHQVNLVFLAHPETKQIHAFIVASHEDHEGPWQEFVSCDELLDCPGWDEFLEGLYSYRLDSGLDLSVTNRDAFFQLMPEWVDLLV